MNKITESVMAAIDNVDNYTLNEEEEIKEEVKEDKSPSLNYALNKLLNKIGDPKAFDFLNLASQLYKEADNDIDEIPDYEDTNDYIMECTRSEYNVAYKAVKQAIENVDGHLYNGNIELSDRATMYRLEAPEDIAESELEDLYGRLRDQAFEEFERITGAEIWQDGRMGRHIVVENTFSLAYNYNDLCAEQESQEDWVVETFNDEMKERYGEEESTDEENPSVNESEENEDYNKNFDKAQATLPLDNYHSIGIIVNGDVVQYMYSNEGIPYESDIEYDENGEPFFRDEEGYIWKISDFMRKDI